MHRLHPHRHLRLPDPADPQHEIWIRHEAIPDFTSDEGQVVGMDAMTMPFALAEGGSAGSR